MNIDLIEKPGSDNSIVDILLFLFEINQIENMRALRITQKNSVKYEIFGNKNKITLSKDINLLALNFYSQPEKSNPSKICFIFHRNYLDMTDYFLFDQDIKIHNRLSNKVQFSLIERLTKIIDLVYSMHFKAKEYYPGGEYLDKLIHLKKYPNKCKLNLSDKQIAYFQKLSLLGSTKLIGQNLNISSRSVEKMIVNLSKRLNIPHKTNIQLLSRVVSTHFNDNIRSVYH